MKFSFIHYSAVATVVALMCSTLTLNPSLAVATELPTDTPSESIDRLIVAYEPGVLPEMAPDVATGDDSISQNVTLSPGDPIGGGMRTVEISETVTEEEALAIAAELTADPRVKWAEPDTLMKPVAEIPSGIAEITNSPEPKKGEVSKVSVSNPRALIKSSENRQSLSGGVTIQTACDQSTSTEPIARCFNDSDSDAGASTDAEIIYSDAYVTAADRTKLIVDSVPWAEISDSGWLLYTDTYLANTFDLDGDGAADLAIVPQWASLSANQSTGVTILDWDGTGWVERSSSCNAGTLTRKLGDHRAIVGTTNSWWQMSLDWSCVFGASASNVRVVSLLEDYFATDLSPDNYMGTAMNFSALTPNSPTITAVSPSSGPTSGGTTVTITGTNLGATSSVKFGTVGATINSLTSTSVVVTSPAGSAGSVNITITTPVASATKTSGFIYQIPAGSVDVTVTNPDGSVTRTGGYAYTAPTAPTITSVSPATGPVVGGATLRIVGTGLGSATTVSVGDSNATIVSQTGAEIVATTPAGVAGVFAVSVTNLVGTATRASSYTYVNAPVLGGVSSTSGSTVGGLTLTLSGSDLAAVTGVSIGGTAAVIVSKTQTALTVTSPAHAGGTVSISATSAGGTSSLIDSFTYYAPATLTTLGTTSGSTLGGTSVVINGTNLAQASAVTVGGTAATIVSATATRVNITTPAHAAGVVPVVVTTPAGLVTKLSAFTYVAPARATITSVSPVKGSTLGGTAVTLTGSALSEVSRVTVGGTDATITSRTSTSLVLQTPAHAAGAVNIVLTNPGGVTTATSAFTYVALPTLSGLSPLAGRLTAGTTVTLTGTNLSTATAVTFGGTAATFVSKTATTLVVIAPAKAAGLVTVVVTTPTGTATLTNAYTYVPAPTITAALSPNLGSSSGGSSVTITGTNLAKVTRVTFGGTDGTIEATTATSLRVTTPAHATGLVSVVVTSPGGSVTRASAFSYTLASASINKSAFPTNTSVLSKDSAVERSISSMTALLSPNSGVKRAAEEGGAKSDPRNNRPGEVQTVGSPSDFTIQTDCLQSTSIQPIQRCFDDSDFDNGASVNAEIIWSDNYTLASSPGYLVSDIVPYYAITDSYWLSYADTGIDFFFDTNGDSSADIGITPNYSQSTVLSANSSIGISIFTLSGSSVTPRTGSCSGTITRKAGDHLKIIGTSNSWWQLRVDTACLFGSSGSNVRSLSYLEDYLGFDISPDYFSGAAMNLTAATAPSITGITPTSGSTSGGTSVTITGARLTGATVSFGGTNGTVTSNTGSSLVVTSPAHAAGTVTVLVATSFGSATQSFTFVSPPPTITNISPTTGTASGGTNVTITGTQLTGASVTIGGASATVVSNSGTALVVTSPAHAAGVVNIVLTTTGGSITRASAFTYVSTTPTITSISPATGTSTGGETVVISGTNLSNVTSITFGGQAATILSRTATTVTLVTPAAAPAPTLPTDPYYSNGTLWGLSGTYGVNSPQAWGRTKGSPDVVVAVIDTGILPHADRGQIVAGYDFVSDSNMANDGTGWDSDPTDQGDWISASENSSGFFAGCGQSDSSWHGTHVAGTIAGASNNIGIVGVAPNVKVQPVRVLGKCGGYTSDIIAGIYWASGISPVGAPTNATPADVINMSLGGSGSCTSSMQTAIDSANSRGVTVVVAAGNSNTNAITAEPANCNGVVVVGATDSNGRRASFSNYGSVVDVSAPGVGIYSTLNTGRTSAALDTYVSYNGTSMATPHVAGVVALMLSINPLLTPSQVETKLKATVRSFGGATCDVANSSLLCGSGIVNAGSALQ